MPEISPSKYLVSVGWSEVPHLDAKTQRELLASTPVHLRKARSLGIPSLGAGAIYPIEEELVVVNDFRLPRHYPRGYAMDVGWNFTAALWGALDRDTDILYVYAEYKREQSEPIIHGAAIKARGKWMTGAIDPASRGRSQHDGQQLYALYQKQDLNLVFANNEVEAGIFDVWERLSTGRIKFFRSLINLLTEYRIYRRDEHGKIVKKHDHLMDCLRYLVRTPSVLKLMPAERTGTSVGAFIPFDPGMGI